MKHDTPGSLRRGALALLAAAALLAGLSPTAARADVAPPPPPAGVDILPGDATQVRMAAETVLIEAQPNNYGEPARAKVEASFTMRNLGEQEERMQVRFPLNSLYPHYQSDFNVCVFPAAYPEIADFRAEVDGKTAPVTTTVVRMRDEFQAGQPEKDVKCWANFPVTFPPGTDVNITVRYSVEGYHAWDTAGIVQFPYVLVTGRDWKDTIGRAEIIFRAPFALDAQNLMEYYPEDGQVSGRELRWVYEDFEPENNISATITNPGLRGRITREQDALAKNPNDGEAWGRLGRWYKEAIKLRRGFRWDAGGLEMFALSRAAYEKTVALLPKDADWHAGYAELLCWNAWFDGIGGGTQRRDDLVRCADEIRLALAINPNQALARRMVEEELAWGDPPPVQVSGQRYDFLILTTTPTAQPTDIIIEEPTAAPSPTAAPPTPVPSPTAAPAQNPTPVIIARVDLTRTAEAANTAAAKPTDFAAAPTQPAPGKNSAGARGLCGAAFAPIAAALWLGLRRRTGQ